MSQRELIRLSGRQSGKTLAQMQTMAVEITELRATVARLEGEMAGLREALERARGFVQAELNERVDGFTVDGDMATLDETDGGSVGEAMDCLARIVTALGEPR